METGYLPVIGLRDAMCLMATSPGKKGSRPSETQLRNQYVDNALHEVTSCVQCNQMLRLLVATQCSCTLLNFFNPWMAECGGIE